MYTQKNYYISIDGKPLDNVEQGIVMTRDWEEKLDSGTITIALSDRKEKFEMFSFIEFKIEDIDEDGIIHKKEFQRLIIKDDVQLDNKYNYYKHTLTLIEYTYKIDNYMKSSYTSTNVINETRLAPFEYDEMYVNDSLVVVNDRNEGNFEYVNKLYLPPINPIYDIYDRATTKRIVINKTPFARFMDNLSMFDNITTLVRTNMPVSNPSGNPSVSNITWDLNLVPVGKYTIEYGVIFPEDAFFPVRIKYVFKYHIEIVDTGFNKTLYDVVMDLRDTVSKYGGVESKKYFDETRMFNLNETDAKFLKTIESPQLFLPNATLGQVLRFIFSFVNALPRLENTVLGDELRLEYFNQSFGEFKLENYNEWASQQDTNQIGIRSYSELKNILPNDLNNPTVYSPSQDGLQTVRATGIELNDNTFEIKLPRGKKLYKPVSLQLELDYKITEVATSRETTRKVMLDLTDLWINKSEWELKDISTNFPSAYYPKMLSSNTGLPKFKVNNLYWEKGDTSIKFSDTYGEILKTTLLESIIAFAVRKDITLNPLEPYIDSQGTYRNEYKYEILNLNGSQEWYKNLKFKVEYITDENMVIRQDKEDLTQIDFYSEIRHNQDESTIDLDRASRKIYGDLQRTGNETMSFSKRHFNIKEIYDVGLTDINNFTITSINYRFYNYYIDCVYTITKYHNRISQATFIDQTYRWRDNYADQLVDRQEPYNDYVLFLPITSETSILNDEHTKLSPKEANIGSNASNITLQVLLGVLGVKHDIEQTKATNAIVRTDGFISEFETDQRDTVQNGLINSRFINVPISSSAYKQGLIFKFNFDSNMIAGDALIKRGDKYYNEAIKYTDRNGKFKYIDFHILNKYKYTDYDKYPIVNVEQNIDSDYVSFNDKDVYFTTGKIVSNRTSDDSILINKDTMSNFGLHYGLNVLSYYTEMFVFGNDFYKNNHLVNNPNLDPNYKLNLYIYDNKDYYKIFQDLKIKEGYIKKLNTFNVRLINNNLLRLDYQLLPNETHWAIGDNEGNLIFASNLPSNEIKILRRHLRPNVNVIGEFEHPSELRLNTNVEIEFMSSYTYRQGKTFKFDATFNIETDVIVLDNLDTHVSIETVSNIEYRQGVRTNYIESLSLESVFERDTDNDFIQVVDVETNLVVRQGISKKFKFEVEMITSLKE